MMNLEHRCGLLIKEIHTTLEKNTNNSLRKDDLTTAQLSVLIALNEARDKRASLKELEKILHLAQSTTAGIVSRLVQKGLVKYTENELDRRVKIAIITEEGERCCYNAEETMKAQEKVMFSELTDIESNIFICLLEKVAGSIR